MDAVKTYGCGDSAAGEETLYVVVVGKPTSRIVNEPAQDNYFSRSMCCALHDTVGIRLNVRPETC